MLTVTPITNVKSTINNISFKAGVRSNYGADVIKHTTDVRHEGNMFVDFLGTIKQSPLFYDLFYKRQKSIEKGLDVEKNKIDAMA